MKYISLKSILNFIPNGIKNETTIDTLLDYAFSGYRQLNITQAYEYKVEVLPIVNHKVKLPDGLRLINNVTYSNTDLCNEDVNDINLCAVDQSEPVNVLPPVTPPSEQKDPIWLTINYRLFVETEVCRMKFQPMRYIGVSKNVFCPGCPNLANHNCGINFTLDPEANFIVIQELNEGYVCLDYSAELASQDNSFLIPDDDVLKQALAQYAIALALRDRYYSKEEGTGGMYEKEMQKANQMMRQARGRFILKAIDINKTWAILNDTARIMKLPRVWNK